MLAIVVDDDTVTRVIASRILLRAGVTSIGFANADDALALLEPLHPDVSMLLTDVSMPGSMDGLELARRTTVSAPHLPVLVMSGSDDSLAAARGIDGIAGVIGKPLSAELLVDAVRGAFGGRDGYPNQCDARR
jgi:CheY-like chemotaxis protein